MTGVRRVQERPTQTAVGPALEKSASSDGDVSVSADSSESASDADTGSSNSGGKGSSTSSSDGSSNGASTSGGSSSSGGKSESDSSSGNASSSASDDDDDDEETISELRDAIDSIVRTLNRDLGTSYVASKFRNYTSSNRSLVSAVRNNLRSLLNAVGDGSITKAQAIRQLNALQGVTGGSDSNSASSSGSSDATSKPPTDISGIDSTSGSISGDSSAFSGSDSFFGSDSSSSMRGSLLPGSDSASTDGGISSGAITGIVVGVVVGVVVVGLILWRLCWKNKNDDDTSTLYPSDGQYLSTDRPQGLDPQSISSGKFNGTQISNQTLIDAEMWNDAQVTAVRVPLEKLKLGHIIGRGGYGEVYYGTYKGTPVAVKKLRPDHRRDLAKVNALLSEVKVTSQLDHQNIVSFVGVGWDQLIDLCILFEFMNNGDLRSMLNEYRRENRPLGFDLTKTRIAFQVANALVYLHSFDPPLIHRDLKSRNILMNTDMVAKVSDFGTTREIMDLTMTAGVGTSLWMAPEVIMGERYDAKADIFSFGIVLSELDTYNIPYGHARETDSGRSRPEAALLQMVAFGRLKAEFSEEAADEMVQLGKECTSLKPEERPTAAEASYRLHQYLRAL